MSLLKGKHIVKEIESQRCTVVETGADKARVDFLKELLEFNKLEVKFEEEVKKPNPDGEIPPVTFVIGVTDLVFNPVIAVYQRILKTKDGRKITADFWNQKTEETEPNYWDLQKKGFEYNVGNPVVEPVEETAEK